MDRFRSPKTVREQPFIWKIDPKRVTCLRNSRCPGLGQYELNAGTLAVNELRIGHSGNGHLIQPSGTVLIDEFLGLGVGEDSTGRYTLGGGSLTVNGPVIVGSHGTAEFSQAGDSTVAASQLSLNNFGEARYHLWSGTLNVSGATKIGQTGPPDTPDVTDARFVQSGGIHTVDHLALGQEDRPNGGRDYLEGGVLNAASAEVRGVSRFEQSGGEATFTESLGIYAESQYVQHEGILRVGVATPDDWGSFSLFGQFSQLEPSSQVFVRGNAAIDGSGRYTLSAGTFQVIGPLFVGGRTGQIGLAIQGGDVDVDGLYLTGRSAQMTSGHLISRSALEVGRLGDEPYDEIVFHQTGGIVDVEGDLVLRRDSGASLYTLADAGQLNVCWPAATQEKESGAFLGSRVSCDLKQDGA